MLPVIHFECLADLLDEFADGWPKQTVRVAVQQRTETRTTTYGEEKHITLNVFVRAIHNGSILSYVPFDKTIRITPFTDDNETRQQYKAAWAQVQEIRKQLTQIILDHGHTPRPGILDMGAVLPVPGHRWKLADETA